MPQPSDRLEREGLNRSLRTTECLRGLSHRQVVCVPQEKRRALAGWQSEDGSTEVLRRQFGDATAFAAFHRRRCQKCVDPGLDSPSTKPGGGEVHGYPYHPSVRVLQIPHRRPLLDCPGECLLRDVLGNLDIAAMQPQDPHNSGPLRLAELYDVVGHSYPHTTRTNEEAVSFSEASLAAWAERRAK